MSEYSLQAISPVDGRYAAQVKELQAYVSEYALFKYRLMVEVEYFIALCELPLPHLIKFPKTSIRDLKDIYKKFKPENAEQIKEIERETNHDVKAVEYYFKQQLDSMGFGEFKEFVHFGLTSQDINNTATPLMLKDAIDKVYTTFLEQETLKELKTLAGEWKDIPMLARTHGQPATPTRLGKEILVFVDRLQQQIKSLKQIPVTGKFGGATGNLNAHYAAFGAINWKSFADSFTHDKLGLSRQQHTTQIEHYDYMADFFDTLRRINNILIDLCRDMWQYISMDYFKQRIKKSEVGSSAMPHKVNPIDFENAEGNLGLANAYFQFMANKLPISRLQRDLTDSTVTRNIGVPLAHTLIALKSIQKGLDKLMLNRESLDSDLNDNWAVVAEGIQSILRREGFEQPYEMLKELTRTNERIDEKAIREFIEGLEASPELKNELKELSPYNYVGR